jgi:hypothetical protein
MRSDLKDAGIVGAMIYVPFMIPAGIFLWYFFISLFIQIPTDSWIVVALIYLSFGVPYIIFSGFAFLTFRLRRIIPNTT